MAELGPDLSAEFPKLLTDEVVRAAAVVITMGCGDDIDARVETLLADLVPAPA